MAKKLDCQQCGSSASMKRKTISSGNIRALFFGLLSIGIGIALLFVFPIGTIIGVFFIFYGLTRGGTRKKVWKCGDCGHFFEYC